MTKQTEQGAALASCPCCGGKASMRHSHDADGCYWAHIECDVCGLRTRGEWASRRSEACSIFYGEVRMAWNGRSAIPTPEGCGCGAVPEDHLRIAELVLHAGQNRRDKDWTLMHLDLSEAIELAEGLAATSHPTPKE